MQSIRVICLSVLDFLARPYAFECFIRRERLSHRARFNLVSTFFTFLPFARLRISSSRLLEHTAGHRSLPTHTGCVGVTRELKIYTSLTKFPLTTRQYRVIMQPTPVTVDHLTPLSARLLCVPLVCRALVAALHFAGVLL